MKRDTNINKAIDETLDMFLSATTIGKNDYDDITEMLDVIISMLNMKMSMDKLNYKKITPETISLINKFQGIILNCKINSVLDYTKSKFLEKAKTLKLPECE